MLTADRLRELTIYDGETGNIYDRVTGERLGYPDSGYWRVIIDGERHWLHRLAWLYVTGEWPPHLIDHRDTDRNNNRWSNIRPATKGQNGANRGPSKANKLGVKGVSLCRATGKYRADINVSGKRINLGRFPSVEEAHSAYRVAAEQHFGEFARAS